MVTNIGHWGYAFKSKFICNYTENCFTFVKKIKTKKWQKLELK